MNFDRPEIMRTAQTFHEPGDIIELRIPKAGRYKTISGYFSAAGVLADSVVGLADEDFAGYYFIINRLNPDLLARSANKYTKYAKETTSDADILRRLWLPIDLDPIRPAGISSNEEEHNAALQKARDIRVWLISMGWSSNAFILADSGNGSHLTAKIDLPNDEQTRDLVKDCLEALDSKFSDDKVKVDTSTFNAGRIWKIYGTMARKGSNTSDRPHRMAKILEAPETAELAQITREQLTELAAILPKSKSAELPGKEALSVSAFDPAKYARDHGAEVLRVESWADREGGKWDLAILAQCPFDSSHDRGEARVGVRMDGKRTFRCFHDSCQGKDWQALKKLWGSTSSAKNGDSSGNNYNEAKAERTGQTVLTALQSLMDHEDKIKGECTWEWRLQMKRIDKVLREGHISQAGEKKAHTFLKKFKNVLEELGIDYYDLHPLLLKTKDNKEEFSPEIKEKALDILKNGDPVQYIADSCGKMVLGAETAFKKLTSCISVQNINQSSGLHPKLTGQSSGGKTWTVYGFAHHLPKEAVIKGSMSAKAGFYHSDGDRVLRILDDYQAGNEDLDTVIKQTSSEYHEPYEHRTVVKQIAATLKIGCEQTWAITSVNNEQDIQVLNRSIPINIDDSVELTKEINNRTVQRYGEGEETKPVNESVLVSRCIFQILRDEGYIDIKVPFWERIEWLDTSNRRNPSIFMDLVIAYTGMMRYQRAKDPEGYYLATEADFQAAKALFTDKDGEELVKRLTRRERDTLELLIANSSGLTRDDIAETLKIAPQQVSQILGGRNGQGGLLQKVQIREDKISEMVRITNEHSRTIHKTVFSLKDYDRFSGFDAVVRLKPLSRDSGNQENIDESIDESKQNKSRIDNESKERKNKNKIEEENSSSVSSSSSSTSHEESTLSRRGGKNAFAAFAMAKDSETDAFVNASSCFPESMEKHGLGPHPRRDEPIPSAKPRFDILRFLKDIPGFCGVDMIVYGPFKAEEVATVPHENAWGLIDKHVAILVSPGGAGHRN